MSNTQGRATRDAYGEAILELGKDDSRIYVIDCDIGRSCKTVEFARQLPQQHINVGIAEQNACGVAAGLATCGKIPFVTTYAVFGSMRMLEQIRQEVCYPHLNVKIACSHGGLTPANDGASHQGIEDMGLLRPLANMTVVAPADFASTKALVKAAAAYDGPVYLRFTRDAVPFIYDDQDEFEIGKAVLHSEGTDLTIISTGAVLDLCRRAAALLEERSISVRLVDMHTIKPIDRAAVLSAIATTKGIITVEDHTIINGLGSAVAEIVSEIGTVRMRRIGVQDQFGESAPYERLLEKNGITVDGIVKAAQELLG